LGRFVEAVPDDESFGSSGELFNEVVVDPFMDHEPGRRNTNLAGIPELCRGQQFCRLFDICVLED
jgi:hypothetical protein